MAAFSAILFVFLLWTGLALGTVDELKNSGRFPFVMGYQLGDNDPKNLTDNRDEDYDHWVKYVHVTVNDTCCPEGKFGGQCEQNCSCPDNATCHTLNGACKCPDGRTGQFCDAHPIYSAHVTNHAGNLPLSKASTNVKDG
uniref:EGF-like domain-containing protein n=1 Tax=Branchiostoma floridae TaxID=7739 RepID=C3ZEW7_BRAFL|eukprot:XP_002593262.1 hypothetical protein BRAFLDRAFT_87243 [Branchiostoma floridae]